MKILFAASDAQKESPLASLDLVQELTLLQGEFLNISSAEFAFFPNIRLTQLRQVITTARPDILHLSAHGNSKVLAFLDDFDRIQTLNIDTFRAILPSLGPKPKLLYLSSCDSQSIAQELVNNGTVETALGISATISNVAARNAAIEFYKAVVSGTSLGEAVSAANGQLRLAGDGVSIEIYPKHSQDVILNPQVELVARFLSPTPRAVKGLYTVEVGLSGCPEGVSQATFATTGDSFTVFDTPSSGMLWADDWKWETDENDLFHVLALVNNAEHVTSKRRLSDALAASYAKQYRKQTSIPRPIREAISAIIRGPK
jgi:hypothetical protein